MNAHPALFEEERRGGAKKVRKKVRNNFIPDYIHIQNQTLKSNISKTVRDREKVSMEVSCMGFRMVKYL